MTLRLPVRLGWHIERRRTGRRRYGYAVVRAIGLVVHGGRPAALAAAARVRDWARRQQVPCVDIDVWSQDAAGRRRTAWSEAEAAGRPDLVVTVGGDGTFLRGVRVALAVDAAVLGINVGRVGFLTEIGVEEIESGLAVVHAGRADVESRLTLTMRASRRLELPEGMESLLRYGRGPTLPAPAIHPSSVTEVGWGVALDVTAVNDVVFEKLARDRQASLGVYLESRLFASYSADALIVASPTGSTAYSFAAGGPVLSPRVDALIMTPVAPHMVFDRSIVVAGDEPVALRVLDRSGQVAVSIDGQLCGVLDPGDWVAVYAAPQRARLIRLGPTDFYGRLRQRFGLADAPAALADGTAPAEYRPHFPVPPDLMRLHGI